MRRFMCMLPNKQRYSLRCCTADAWQNLNCIFTRSRKTSKGKNKRMQVTYITVKCFRVWDSWMLKASKLDKLKRLSLLRKSQKAPLEMTYKISLFLSSEAKIRSSTSSSPAAETLSSLLSVWSSVLSSAISDSGS